MKELSITEVRRPSLWEGGIHWENWSKKCAHDACRLSPWRAILSGKGIQIGDEWLCSPNCLELVLRRRFADLGGSVRPVESPRPARVPLGLMLFSRGYLTADQFKIALEAHRQSGSRVGDVALQFGFVTEEQVASALAAQWGYPVFSLKGTSGELPVSLPLHLMQLHQMLPIQFLEESGKLLVGFATRLDHAVVQGLEKMLQRPADLCFITMSEYRTRIQALASRREQEFVFDRITSSQEMAQVVRSYAVQTSASELRFALCREYLWARMSGARQPLDLLFRLETTQNLSEA